MDQDEATAKSETSSVIPTSARLSIATTTHPFVNAQGNTESIGTMLDGILANPGWSVAAAGTLFWFHQTLPWTILDSLEFIQYPCSTSDKHVARNFDTGNTFSIQKRIFQPR